MDWIEMLFVLTMISLTYILIRWVTRRFIFIVILLIEFLLTCSILMYVYNNHYTEIMLSFAEMRQGNVTGAITALDIPNKFSIWFARDFLLNMIYYVLSSIQHALQETYDQIMTSLGLITTNTTVVEETTSHVMKDAVVPAATNTVA
mmetsp:Transcript_10376/g.15177  ORF Transcript_10376/g.15177 Transcript_10376/m.15177 type:complete len:147 (+) Transcript_10376:37-477(+)